VVVETATDTIYAVANNVGVGTAKRFIVLNSDGVEQWIISNAGQNDFEEIRLNSSNEPYLCGDWNSGFNVFRVDLDARAIYGFMVTNYLVGNGRNATGLAIDPSFSYSPDLSSDVEGYWRMNDNAANTVVVDNSGNSRDGVATKNTSVMTTEGKMNQALSFVEGDVDEVSVSDNSAFDVNSGEDKTYAFWMKWAGSMSGSYATILHKYNEIALSNGTGLLVRKPNTDGQLNAVLFEGVGVTKIAAATSIPTPMTGWIFVVVRLDRSGRLSISVNNWAQSGFVDISGEVATDFSNSEPLSLGGNANRNGTYTAWNGDLDAVGIWSRLLTNEEEDLLWNNGDGDEDFLPESPSITDQSTDTTADIGEAVVFFVTAIGNPSPTYQWKKDGINISGETSSTLSFTAIGSSGGTYTVVVTNSEGSVTSADIDLLVTGNTTISYNAFNLNFDIGR
jgi:hypothetical protein